MIREAHGAVRAIDQCYSKYAPSEMNEVKYSYPFTYDRARTQTRSKKIVVAGDVKRAEGRPSLGTFAAWMVSLGATNVQAGPSESRALVEKGVVDTLTSPWGSMLLFGMEKVTKF